MRRFASISVLAAVLLGLGAPLVNPPITRAQGGAAPMSATVLTNRIQWSATPGSTVTAVVRNARGVKARAQAQANASGVVNLQLGGGGGPGGGGTPYLQPADIISLTVPAGITAVATVPDIAADIEPTTDQVTGKVPAGTSVDVTVVYGAADTDQYKETVTADATGAFGVSLVGKVDVKPGTGGTATMKTADGHSFSAQFAVLQADFAVGSASVTGQASLGTQVQVTLTSAGGQAKGTRTVTVTGDVAWTLTGGGGGPGGRLQAVAVGDTAKVTQSGGAIATPRTLELVVPPLEASVDKTTGKVSGVGPANTSLIVQAIGPDGQTVEERVTTDANGYYSVTLPAQLVAGWRVFVIYDPGSGLRSRTLFVLPQVQVRLYGSTVSGVTTASIPVTVTVRSETGAVKGQANTNAGPNGNYSASIRTDGELISIEPGDFVEIDFTAGDPLVLPVPRVTVHANAGTDTVSGEAPEGANLRVTAGQGRNQVVLDVKATGGTYTADFTGKFDIQPGQNGNVTLTTSAGHQFLTGWAAVQMTMTLDGASVAGNGPAARRVTVLLRTPAGATAATVTTRVPEGGGGGMAGGNSWGITFQDNTNQEVGIRTGDTLVATVGDDVITYVVPRLNGVALIADDTVNGQAEPSVQVHMTITAQGAGGGGGPGGGGIAPVQADVTADEQGLFSHSLAGTRDLIFNDVINLRMTWADHIVLRTIRTPGLRLDINSATLRGSIEPNVAVLALLVTADGQERARVAVTAADDATFVAPFRDKNDEPIVPVAGDRVEVYASKATQTKEIIMTVPELEIRPDKAADTVTGRATPGGLLTLQVAATFFQPGGGGMGGGATRPPIQADGSWTANFPGRFDVVPGQQFAGLYRLAVGHLVSRSVNVPIVNAQIGGGRVCGVGPERVIVVSDLSGATGPTGHGEDRSRNDGSFEVRLEDDKSNEVASVPGQLVHTVIDSETIDVTLPDVTVTVDWTTGRITGKGPANTTIYVSSPARGCLGNRDFGAGGGGFNFNMARTNPNGDFNAQVQARDPGDGFEVAMFTPDGQRVYRQVFRTLGQIYVRTDQVGGRATPLLPVTIVLQTAAGVERARGTATADSSGSFSGQVLNGAGKSVTINAGDVVRLEAGAEQVSVPVEDLTFDFEPVNGLIGAAPPNRAVFIALRLADGRRLTIDDRTADSTGRFAYRAADIPPRADWTFYDVRAIRVVLPTAGGHQIISEMQLAGPTPTPEGPRGMKIYLPMARKGR